MTTTIVSGPGTIYSGTIAAGDEVDVENGATSLNATVYGTEVIAELERSSPPNYPGGSAEGSVVEAGGTLDDENSVTGSTILAGGTMDVGGLRGATAANDLIYGSEVVSGLYDRAADETVFAGGSIAVESDGQVSDIDLVGGTLTLAGGVASGITIAGGTIDAIAPVFGGSALDGDLVFEGPGGLAELTRALAGEPTISGFGPGDAIAITDPVNFALSVSGDTVVFAGATLDITGASALDLQATFENGLPALVSAVCFLAGTMIATPTGERAVETLVAGDLVLTAGGEARPVRWLGRQTVAARFAEMRRVAPVRIRAGALGDGLPVRDLRVSPDHALMVDGVLVQAGALVNGMTVTAGEAGLPERFTYYHVELADHSLILAEGVAAESFIDNVDRLAFDNWDEHAALPDAGPLAEMAFPRAKSARQVPPALHRMLRERAALLAGGDVAAA